MRPWDTFSAREADDYDYSALADALKPDWSLLDHHNWQHDFRQRYGDELDDDAIRQHAELAATVLGMNPTTLATAEGAARAAFMSRGANQEERDRPHGAARNGLGQAQQLGPQDFLDLEDQRRIVGGSSRPDVPRSPHPWQAAAEQAPLGDEIQAGWEEASRMTHPVPPEDRIGGFLQEARGALGRAIDWGISRIRQPDGFEHLDPEVRRILEGAREATQREIEAVLDNWPGRRANNTRHSTGRAEPDYGEDNAQVSGVRRKPQRPAHPNQGRCLDACASKDASNGLTWNRFCQSLRTPQQQAICYSHRHDSETSCRNYCFNEFGRQ